METTELRVNNLIIHRGQVHPVNISILQSLLEKSMPTDYFKPIPLTEEWLIKFGFEKYEVEAKGIDVWNDWYLGNFIISSSGTIGEAKNIFDFVGREGIVTKVEYVHQLQNIYHSLLQQELKIKEIKK